jgi:hypothetical protein
MKEELSENNRTVPQPGIIACMAKNSRGQMKLAVQY